MLIYIPTETLEGVDFQKQIRLCDEMWIFGKSTEKYSVNVEKQIAAAEIIGKTIIYKNDNSGAVHNSNDFFARFWEAYPKKANKPAAQRAFNKLKVNEDLLKIMLISIAAYKKTKEWKLNNGQFIPYPSTWLNGRRWEDPINIEISEAEKNDYFKTAKEMMFTDEDYDD